MEERQARVAVEAGDDDAPADLAHAAPEQGSGKSEPPRPGLPARGVTFGQKSYGLTGSSFESARAPCGARNPRPIPVAARAGGR